MEERDEVILNHVGRYTISLRKVIGALYFDGGSANNAVNRLVRESVLQRNSQAFEGNYTYYQLTKKGCGLLGIAPNKARPKDERGLAQDLGALWFSCMGEVSRKRL